jgi:signal transduction histidine kinase
MLRARDFEPDRVREIYDSVYRNAQIQAQLVNDLLDVSRIVTGQLKLDLQAMDVCEVARLSLETIRPAATAKGVVIESEIPDSECHVSGDPARLQQVIWNLLSNAIKFTPARGSVGLAIRPSQDRVAIEVSDTGIGIAATVVVARVRALLAGRQHLDPKSQRPWPRSGARASHRRAARWGSARAERRAGPAAAASR